VIGQGVQWIGRVFSDVASVWDHCDLMVEQGEDISTTEAEYMATSIASCEAAWLRKFLARLHPRHDVEGSCEALVHIHR
jgi:hypothetical protein